jgi:hypothetical protein
MMSDTTQTREGDWSSWVRDHQVCWELKPAQEMVKGHGLLQTGFELKLFGCFDPRPEDDVTPIRRSIHERLRTLVGEVAGAMPVRPLMQVEPPGRVVITPEEIRSAASKHNDHLLEFSNICRRELESLAKDL